MCKDSLYGFVPVSNIIYNEDLLSLAKELPPKHFLISVSDADFLPLHNLLRMVKENLFLRQSAYQRRMHWVLATLAYTLSPYNESVASREGFKKHGWSSLLKQHQARLPLPCSDFTITVIKSNSLPTPCKNNHRVLPRNTLNSPKVEYLCKPLYF